MDDDMELEDYEREWGCHLSEDVTSDGGNETFEELCEQILQLCKDSDDCFSKKPVSYCINGTCSTQKYLPSTSNSVSNSEVKTISCGMSSKLKSEKVMCSTGIQKSETQNIKVQIDKVQQSQEILTDSCYGESVKRRMTLIEKNIDDKTQESNTASGKRVETPILQKKRKIEMENNAEVINIDEKTFSDTISAKTSQETALPSVTMSEIDVVANSTSNEIVVHSRNVFVKPNIGVSSNANSETRKRIISSETAEKTRSINAKKIKKESNTIGSNSAEMPTVTQQTGKVSKGGAEETEKIQNIATENSGWSFNITSRKAQPVVVSSQRDKQNMLGNVTTIQNEVKKNDSANNDVLAILEESDRELEVEIMTLATDTFITATQKKEPSPESKIIHENKDYLPESQEYQKNKESESHKAVIILTQKSEAFEANVENSVADSNVQLSYDYKELESNECDVNDFPRIVNTFSLAGDASFSADMNPEMLNVNDLVSSSCTTQNNECSIDSDITNNDSEMYMVVSAGTQNDNEKEKTLITNNYEKHNNYENEQLQYGSARVLPFTRIPSDSQRRVDQQNLSTPIERLLPIYDDAPQRAASSSAKRENAKENTHVSGDIVSNKAITMALFGDSDEIIMIEDISYSDVPPSPRTGNENRTKATTHPDSKNTKNVPHTQSIQEESCLRPLSTATACENRRLTRKRHDADECDESVSSAKKSKIASSSVNHEEIDDDVTILENIANKTDASSVNEKDISEEGIMNTTDMTSTQQGDDTTEIVPIQKDTVNDGKTQTNRNAKESNESLISKKSTVFHKGQRKQDANAAVSHASENNTKTGNETLTTKAAGEIPARDLINTKRTNFRCTNNGNAVKTSAETEANDVSPSPRNTILAKSNSTSKQIQQIPAVPRKPIQEDESKTTVTDPPVTSQAVRKLRRTTATVSEGETDPQAPPVLAPVPPVPQATAASAAPREGQVKRRLRRMSGSSCASVPTAMPPRRLRRGRPTQSAAAAARPQP